jgi:hypothetical protein
VGGRKIGLERVKIFKLRLEISLPHLFWGGLFPPFAAPPSALFWGGLFPPFAAPPSALFWGGLFPPFAAPPSALFLVVAFVCTLQ